MADIEKILNEYKDRHIVSKDTEEQFRLGVNTMLSNLNKATSKTISKLLADKLGKIVFVSRAKEIKVIDMFERIVDYGHAIGVGGGVKTIGRTEDSLARLLVSLEMKLTSLEQEIKSHENYGNHLRKDISLLMRGKATIEDCPICDGTGELPGKDFGDKAGPCWNCNGDKKVIKKQ